MSKFDRAWPHLCMYRDGVGCDLSNNNCLRCGWNPLVEQERKVQRAKVYAAELERSARNQVFRYD